MQLRALFWRWDVAGFSFCVAMFALFPNLDLQVAATFYDSELEQFPANDALIVEIVYRVFADIHIPILLLLIGLLIRWRGPQEGATARRKRQTIFLLTTLLVGPGLITHTFLKDNSFDRPRPRQIEAFDGAAAYAPPFHYSGECRRNCSFVSGHAAIGFWFLVIGWALRQRQWFALGLMIGLVVGGFRVIQGAHFVSDVIFAFWVVYLTGLLCRQQLLGPVENEKGDD